MAAVQTRNQVVTVDQDTGRAYLPLANVAGHPVLRQVSVTATASDDDD